MKVVPKRRRRQQKTDYAMRMKLLQHGSGRVAFRKTNRRIIGQYIESKEAQDKVVFSVDSKSLINLGWPKEKSGSLKSLPASYLTGFLLGKKMIKNGNNKAIFDIGLQRSVKKSRMYAFLKGIIDAGVAINTDKSALPNEDMINGKNPELSHAFINTRKKIENGK